MMGRYQTLSLASFWTLLISLILVGGWGCSPKPHDGNCKQDAFESFCEDRCGALKKVVNQYTTENNKLIAELEKLNGDPALIKTIKDRNAEYLSLYEKAETKCKNSSFTYYGGAASARNQDIASNACRCEDATIGSVEPGSGVGDQIAFNRNNDAILALDDQRAGARRTELLGNMPGLSTEEKLDGKAIEQSSAIIAIQGETQPGAVNSTGGGSGDLGKKRGFSGGFSNGTSSGYSQLGGNGNFLGSSSFSNPSSRNQNYSGGGGNSTQDQNSATYGSGSGSGKAKGDATNEFNNPFESLTALMGLGPDGKGLGANSNSTLEIKPDTSGRDPSSLGKNSDLKSARASDDPDDYFSRIKSHLSLFEEVERCYMRKSTQGAFSTSPIATAP